MHAAVAAGGVGRPAVLRLSRRVAWPEWGEWFSDSWRSGGVLVDLMIHEHDYARLLAGDVTWVYARTHVWKGFRDVVVEA